MTGKLLFQKTNHINSVEKFNAVIQLQLQLTAQVNQDCWTDLCLI